MKHLIVVAHPEKSSLTMTLARAYAAELENMGHQQKTRDLYRNNFNPILSSGELHGVDADHPPAADVKQEQDEIRIAEALAVIYPLWWMSMPAMMKGYIDRVFARGFASMALNGLVRGLLSGRKCILVTISGAPLPVLVGTGRWNAVLALQDTHVFRAAGLDLLEHVHFDEVTSDLPKVKVDEHIARIRRCARQHFSVAQAET